MIQQTLVALKRIGDDLKLEINSTQLIMRSLNSSNSALPVIRFQSAFFSNFEYSSENNSILCQLSIQYLLQAFKNIQNASSLLFHIDPQQMKFVLRLDDKNSLSHSWELFMQSAVVMTAVYDLESACASVKCRCDVFNGVKSAFRGSDHVFLECIRQEGTFTQMILSSAAVNDCVSSSLIIKKGELCDIQFSEDCNRVKLNFSLADFLVAIKLSSIFNPKLEMFLIQPGHPIIIRSQMMSQVNFEIALATAIDEFEEMSNSQMAIPPHSYPEVGTGQSTAPTDVSQTSPWRGPQQSVHTTQQSQTPAASEEERQGLRDSQLLAMGLFEASPDFPYRRKITGQFAENSQPVSSESSSDSDS